VFSNPMFCHSKRRTGSDDGYLDDVFWYSHYPRPWQLPDLTEFFAKRRVLLRQARRPPHIEVEATPRCLGQQLVSAADELTAARQQLVQSSTPMGARRVRSTHKIPESLELTYERSYTGDFATPCLPHGPTISNVKPQV